MPRWNRSNTSVYNLGYHVIWIPKYRRKLLTPSIEIRLKELLSEKSKEIGVEIVSMETMPDHIHLFLKCSPQQTVSDIIHRLKGYTSRMLRKEFIWLRNMRSMWTRSYYCESIGHISEKTIKKYIRDQKLRG